MHANAREVSGTRIIREICDADGEGFWRHHVLRFTQVLTLYIQEADLKSCSLAFKLFY